MKLHTLVLCLLGAVAAYAATADVDHEQFRNLMERNLQGFANDPSACRVDGTRFDCNTPSSLSSTDGNRTLITTNVNCALDPQIRFDFQRSEDCRCQAQLEQQYDDGTTGRSRTCACSICPVEADQAVAVNCSMVEDDPFILGTCETLDCYGRCNGPDGPVVIPPASDETEDDTQATEQNSAGSVGVLMSLLVSAAVFVLA